MLELTTTIYNRLGMGSPDTLITSMAMAALAFACLSWLLRLGYQAQERVLASNSQCAALANAIPPPRLSGKALSESLSWIDGSGRVFVNALPAELTSLYKPNPSHQADKLFEIYRGKWIVTTFTVGDVERDDSTLGNSVMVLSDEQIRKPLIAAMFDLKWKARLAQLKKGDPISIRGQISSGNSAYIGLRNCELSDDAGEDFSRP